MDRTFNLVDSRKLLKKCTFYTDEMMKYGYDTTDDTNGFSIVLNKDMVDRQRHRWNKEQVYIEHLKGKTPTVEVCYNFYKEVVKFDKEGGNKGEIINNPDISFVTGSDKHVDYPKRQIIENTMEVGIYDTMNAKYSIDMDFYDSLDEDMKENYLKQSFLSHYLYLGTCYDNVYPDKVQESLDIKPFFDLEVPESHEVGLSWPILGDYDELGVVDDDDYLDIKKFLEVNDDSILICVISEPNEEYPDYYEPEPDTIIPLSRSYLKNLYSPYTPSGDYKGDFASIAYRCAKDMEGLDINFVFMKQLYLLSPYFVLPTESGQYYIDTKDVIMMMHSSHKVFGLRKYKEISISAGVNIINAEIEINPFGERVNIVSADHCQPGSNKNVYRVLLANIEEYTEVEREETVRVTESITKEELYEKYPEVKKILEESQRCKDPRFLSQSQLEQEFKENNIYGVSREVAIETLKKIYERREKIKKIMKLNIPQEAKTRAQQEAEIGFKELTDEEIRNCTISAIVSNVDPYFDYKQRLDEELSDGDEISQEKIQAINEFQVPDLKEFAERMYDVYYTDGSEQLSEAIKNYLEENVPQIIRDFSYDPDGLEEDIKFAIEKFEEYEDDEEEEEGSQGRIGLKPYVIDKYKELFDEYNVPDADRILQMLDVAVNFERIATALRAYRIDDREFYTKLLCIEAAVKTINTIEDTYVVKNEDEHSIILDWIYDIYHDEFPVMGNVVEDITGSIPVYYVEETGDEILEVPDMFDEYIKEIIRTTKRRYDNPEVLEGMQSERRNAVDVLEPESDDEIVIPPTRLNFDEDDEERREIQPTRLDFGDEDDSQSTQDYVPILEEEVVEPQGQPVDNYQGEPWDDEELGIELKRLFDEFSDNEAILTGNDVPKVTMEKLKDTYDSWYAVVPEADIVAEGFFKLAEELYPVYIETIRDSGSLSIFKRKLEEPIKFFFDDFYDNLV